jgi:hypothetical protein
MCPCFHFGSYFKVTADLTTETTPIRYSITWIDSDYIIPLQKVNLSKFKVAIEFHLRCVGLRQAKLGKGE